MKVYKTFRIGNHVGLETKLNELAKEGYSVISINSIVDRNGILTHHVVMEKEITG